jgi:hypothetical protein
MTARRQTSQLLQLLLSTAFTALPLAVAAQTAQPPKTITLRMMDWHTQRLIQSTDFIVQINHQQTEHANWVELNDDGSGKLTLPADAELVLIHGKYDSSMSLYVNCDSERATPIPTVGTQGAEHWYPVADILKSGVVGHNGCGKGKDDAKFAPKPGEFLFFVRKRNWRDSEDQ